MLTMRSLLLPPMLILALSACKTSNTSSDPIPPSSDRLTVNPRAASSEDCKRRAAGMVQSERDMRASPQEVVDTGQPPAKAANWDNGNNPCPERVAAVDPIEDKLITRTQIEGAMQEKDYERARSLLPKLYTSPMPFDASVQALTREVTSSWAPSMIAKHKRANSIIMREEQPVCVATREPHALHDDYETLSEVVPGNEVHIYCGVPNSQADMNTQVRVRYRLSTGRYEELSRKDIGALPDLTVDEGIHITLNLPEEFIAQNAQAYVEVSLMGLTPGQTPVTLSKGSFFWVK